MSGDSGVNTWFELLLRERTEICGKWSRHRYTVIRILGKGANGAVYLVERLGHSYALKIGYEGLIIQTEINSLKQIRFSQREPYFVEADDLVIAGQVYSFYVMRYIDGIGLIPFFKTRGLDWLPVIGIYILQQLHEIHRQGFSFGDLKSENIRVGTQGQPLLIDFGGVTPFGQSVRQFTEKYDRGYWRMGNRKADNTYDLFSFAMICIESIAPKALDRLASLPVHRRQADHLLAMIRTEPSLHGYKSFLESALIGRYHSAYEALQYWTAFTRKKDDTNIVPFPMHWLKILFASSILLFICTLILVLPR